MLTAAVCCSRLRKGEHCSFLSCFTTACGYFPCAEQSVGMLRLPVQWLHPMQGQVQQR
jgi:hypothetical protein